MKKNENKKIMIIVPHEDDELNLAGGILNSHFINKKNIILVFTTNGDYGISGQTRINEALKSAKKMHIPINNVIFLGYSDQYKNKDTHIYMTPNNSVWISQNGKKETYGTNKINDFRFSIDNYHSPFNKESFIKDLYDVIEKYLPNKIFTIDYDSHPDHRCLTLCFDIAMGQLLKKNLDYEPKIYKGFAYPTSFFGYADFDSINLKSTNFKTENNSTYPMQNPYLIWDDRVRFPVAKSVTNKFLPLNNFYKCLRCHKSQLIIKKAFSIINSDQVFWERYSNNLIRFAKIIASSGSIEYLNDFRLFDTNNIMHGDKLKTNFTNISWIPSKEDLKKTLKFTFLKKVTFNQINFYQNAASSDRIDEIELLFSNGYKNNICIKDFICYKYKLPDQKDITWIKIIIKSTTGDMAGFSEIEVLKLDNKPKQNNFIKIVINDDLTYGKYFIKNNINSLKIFLYDNDKNYLLNKDDCYYYLNGKKIDYNAIFLNIKKNNKLKIVVKNNSLEDTVIIKKVTLKNRIINKLIFYLNKIYIFIDVLYLRVINKIKKILKKIKV
mgnify:CR=1 FL=1